MIVVANGDRIIASNDEELADTKVEDSRILQQINVESFGPPRSGISSAMAAPISAVWTAAATTISTPMYPTAW